MLQVKCYIYVLLLPIIHLSRNLLLCLNYTMFTAHLRTQAIGDKEVVFTIKIMYTNYSYW